MRNFKKILVALTVILALVCVFAVAAFATEYQIPVREGWEGPMGVIHDEDGWEDSKFSDIDDHVNFTNGPTDVWVQIGTDQLAVAKTLTTEPSALTYGNGYRTYYNEYERKVVIVVTNSPHSQLWGYQNQDTSAALQATAKKYALWDELYNLYALEYVFTQDAYKSLTVPGLNMTWSEYMSSKIGTADIYSASFPSDMTNSNADSSTSYPIIVMERTIANALYTSYSANETYAAAFAEAGNPSTLTGSTYTPASDKQKMSRALLTGLLLWAQDELAKIYADDADGLAAALAALEPLSDAARAYSDENTWKYYALKGGGGSFGWKWGLENYFGQYGFVSVAFLINTNTSENANVGCLGNTVDTLEVRRPHDLGSYPAFQTFSAVLTAFDETETVLFDKTLYKLDPEQYEDSTRSYFKNMPSLATVTHVTFGKDGKYTDKVNTGVIDLTGFTQITEQCYTGAVGANIDSATDVIWYQTLVYNGTDYSGGIAKWAFRDCGSLKTFTVPANDNAPLISIGVDAFKNSSIEKVYVLRSVSADLTIASTAFSGCEDVTMYVLDKTSAVNAVAALKTAGITNVSVDLYNPIENPVSYEGALVKMKDFESASSDKLAIRFQFIWNEKGTAASNNVAANYTFKSLGIIASTAATYDSYEETVLEETGLASASLVAQEMLAASAGENSKVVNVLVTNADFTDGRRTFLKGYDIDAGYFPFCLSLYGMTGNQITSEYYVAAYTEWTDESGNTFYAFTTIDYTKDGETKNSISLYDTTLGLVKQGLLNSADYESADYANKYLYSVLEKGALTTNSFTSHTVSANAGYTLNDGYFTYWKVDYRKYVLDPDFPANSSLKANVNVGYGYRPDTTEAVPSSGVQWSILKDGAEYVVLLSKNTAAAPEGVTYDYKVPTSGRNSQYGYYQPFHYQYGDVNHGKDTNAKLGSMTVYSPAITKTVFNAIKTVVVDDGIVALDKDSLAAFSPMTTMVLPESCVKIEAYSISKNAALTDIVWTGDPDAKSESKYNVKHLYDLRGCSTVSAGSLLCDNTAVVNVVTKNGINVDGQLAFRSATSLERYWSESGYSDYTKPDSGTIDLSKGWVGTISKGYFDSASKINKIILSGAVKVGLPSDKDGLGRSVASMGRNATYNYVLVGDDTNFSTTLKAFIAYIHDSTSTNYIASGAAYADNLSVNGVPVKTLWPELFS